MELIATDGEHSTICFSSSELKLINNALNEVTNGIDISDAEFHVRLGVSRLEAQQLLAVIGNLLAS